ncbi:MerR family transcriptional regulator [Micromonospora sp. WMMD1082]|uniref:MerR family transcriptional regulator n=1 Tax=Micromonospora sp. WMMD1082 TaxID=3016104 RepID=UPI0024170CC7|nr:MerR family transcriptional regulator [Micromonospora sp. WMMD1082]MDG4793442.1 MerR family transcriptional regulator [Micromonospora sp. WMMD1082]
MRISDLSKRTGVPVATIKFYLREGLLPPGQPTGRNQARYGESHRRQLFFIRALTGIGQLELSSVLELLSAIDDDRPPLSDLYAAVSRAIHPQDSGSTADNDVELVRQEVDRFIGALGWTVDPAAPGRARLARVVYALRQLGCGDGIDFFRPYALLAEQFADRELSLLPTDGDVDRGAAAARAVLFDVALSALRGMAQEHLAAQRFGRIAPEPRDERADEPQVPSVRS